MRSKHWLAIAASALLLAAACGGGGSTATPGGAASPTAGGGGSPAASTPAGPAEQVELKFATYVWQPATVEATDEIVADWNEANPNIQVEIVPIDVESVHDALVTQFQGGTASDIIHDEALDLAGFVNQGFLADMTPLIPEEVKGQAPQGIWDSMTYDGKIYGAPLLLQSYVVFANADHLEEAGIEQPEIDAPWTWDDLQTNAAKVSARSPRASTRWPTPISRSTRPRSAPREATTWRPSWPDAFPCSSVATSTASSSSSRRRRTSTG
jgi:ABC-type glycerol-3-phosphate transport system substrate-binding protein